MEAGGSEELASRAAEAVRRVIAEAEQRAGEIVREAEAEAERIRSEAPAQAEQLQAQPAPAPAAPQEPAAPAPATQPTPAANDDAAARLLAMKLAVDGSSREEIDSELQTKFGPGDRGEPTAEDWATACGTIVYEIVTRIGTRVPRVYVDDVNEDVRG